MIAQGKKNEEEAFVPIIGFKIYFIFQISKVRIFSYKFYKESISFFLLSIDKEIARGNWTRMNLVINGQNYEIDACGLKLNELKLKLMN